MSEEVVKPLSPQDLAGRLCIPDFVIEAVNELLRKHYDGHGCTITLKEVEAAIEKAKPQEAVWQKNWLNFETLFRENGWSVDYDQPGYNETYAAHYRFSRRKV